MQRRRNEHPAPQKSEVPLEGAAEGPAPTADALRISLAAADRRIADLEEAVAARDQFVAVVAHELRNPMVPIVLAVDRARRMAAAGDTGRMTHSLQLLDLAVQNFVRRTVQVLDTTRFNAGQFLLMQEPTDLAALLRDSVAAFAEMARHAGCAVTIVAPDRAEGWFDPAAVRQVAENLLSNALKYGAGRPVEVALSVADGYVNLSVGDHGAGIAESDKQRIFERFERVARRGSPGGFGIGLWLVGRLIAAMDGTVTVDSVIGAGSTFTVRLPDTGAPGAGTKGA